MQNLTVNFLNHSIICTKKKKWKQSDIKMDKEPKKLLEKVKRKGRESSKEAY